MNIEAPGVYQIINKINGDFYIGSAQNLRKRRSHHFSELRSGRHYNSHLLNATKKYLLENFEFRPIILCDIDSLAYYEQVCVDNLKPKYNQRKKVDSNRGVTRSDEFKEKVGDFFRGRSISEEHRKNIGLSNFEKEYPNKFGLRGVSYTSGGPNSKPYKAMFRGKHLGVFNTTEEAHEAYKIARETWLAAGG